MTIDPISRGGGFRWLRREGGEGIEWKRRMGKTKRSRALAESLRDVYGQTEKGEKIRVTDFRGIGSPFPSLFPPGKTDLEGEARYSASRVQMFWQGGQELWDSGQPAGRAREGRVFFWRKMWSVPNGPYNYDSSSSLGQFLKKTTQF